MFGVECCLAVVSFDNNLWETIPVPGVGSIRSLAVDSRGVVWFISSTHIGYLSRVAGEYLRLRSTTFIRISLSDRCGRWPSLFQHRNGPCYLG